MLVEGARAGDGAALLEFSIARALALGAVKAAFGPGGFGRGLRTTGDEAMMGFQVWKGEVGASRMRRKAKGGVIIV